MSRTLTIVLASVILFAARADAQESAPPCQGVAPVAVDVVTTAGTTPRGTLLCLDGSDVWLAADTGPTATALKEVRRITTRPDPAWDGAVKGGILPIVMWLIICPSCDPGPVLRVAAGYAAIGGIWDALDTNRTRIYERERAPTAALRWSVRF